MKYSSEGGGRGFLHRFFEETQSDSLISPGREGLPYLSSVQGEVLETSEVNLMTNGVGVFGKLDLGFMSHVSVHSPQEHPMS